MTTDIAPHDFDHSGAYGRCRRCGALRMSADSGTCLLGGPHFDEPEHPFTEPDDEPPPPSDEELVSYEVLDPQNIHLDKFADGDPPTLSDRIRDQLGMPRSDGGEGNG